MGFIRFLAVAILVWYAWRTYTSWMERRRTENKQQKVEHTAPPADDILEEDPVCGKLVPRSEAVQLEIFNRRFYFCSKECCQAFRKEKGEQL